MGDSDSVTVVGREGRREQKFYRSGCRQAGRGTGRRRCQPTNKSCWAKTLSQQNQLHYNEELTV